MQTRPAQYSHKDFPEDSHENSREDSHEDSDDDSPADSPVYHHEDFHEDSRYDFNYNVSLRGDITPGGLGFEVPESEDVFLYCMRRVADRTAEQMRRQAQAAE